MVDKTIIGDIFNQILNNYSLKCSYPGYVKPKDRHTRPPTAKELEFIENLDEENFKKGDSGLYKEHSQVQKNVKFTEDELSSVADWGASGYLEINGRIYDTKYYRKTKRKHCDNEDDEQLFDENIDEKIDFIINAIEKSPNIEEDTIQFRGGHWEVGTKVGDVIQQEGFASICYDEDYAGMFNDRPSRYGITYLVPTGAKGVWLSEPFNNLGEDEYLTPPGTNLYVLEVDNENKEAKVVILPDL